MLLKKTRAATPHFYAFADFCLSWRLLSMTYFKDIGALSMTYLKDVGAQADERHTRNAKIF